MDRRPLVPPPCTWLLWDMVSEESLTSDVLLPGAEIYNVAITEFVILELVGGLDLVATLRLRRRRVVLWRRRCCACPEFKLQVFEMSAAFGVSSLNASPVHHLAMLCFVCRS